MKIYWYGFFATLFILPAVNASDGKIFIYLIDPKDSQAISDFTAESLFAADAPRPEDWDETVLPLDPIEPLPSKQAPNGPLPSSTSKKTNLDDKINELSEKPALSKSHQRILKTVEADQKKFLDDLDSFIKVEFDEKDDEAVEEFNSIRANLVKLVFDAPSERSYYERLYLINKLFLDHPEADARFISLDKALRDKWLELEDRSRRYRQVILGVSAIGGAIGGGWLSYKISQRIIPMIATEGGIASIGKWVGRATIIFIGAGVGAAAGQYIGFLGSDYLFSRRDYIDPIDGRNQDLRDILDVIERLPASRNIKESLGTDPGFGTHEGFPF